MGLRLSLDYWRCQRVIQKNSATFYKAFSQLKDQHRRQGIYAVYAFCRYVDDLIDVDHNLDGLNDYKAQLDEFVKGYKAKGFRWRALKDTQQRFYQDEKDFLPFYEMIEGQELDAHPVHFQTLEQLERYCDLVAGSVGKMLMPILAPGKKEALLPFAIALGRAFQLTNILRDVGEDYRNQRIYLPQALCDQFGYTLEDLKAERINDAFIQVWEFLAKLATQYYDQALTMIPLFPEDTQFPLLAGLKLYQAILDTIRQQKYSVMQTKHFVSEKDKLMILRSLQNGRKAS
ncbi:MAG: phytoene/squalene synthase family protein [Bacilli bacterium]